MNRSEYKDTKRAFVTEIKQIEANQMLMAARLSRPGTDLHDEVVGPEYEQLAQAQRSMGISEGEIKEKKKECHLDIVCEFSEDANSNHFPRTIYEANVSDIGVLTPDEADAVSSFYQIAHQVQDSYDQLGELAGQAQEDEITFSKVTCRMRRIKSEIKHLCELRERALEIPA